MSGTSVFRIQSFGDSGERDGVCFVIHDQPQPGGRIVYFATSARLFDRDGSRRARIAIGVDPIEVESKNILLPFGNVQDLAVLRVATVARVIRLPLSFEGVHAGEDFEIVALGESGGPVLVSERANFNSTRLVVGSQSPATAQCEGAPALDAQGVFGVVTSCPPNQAPVVSRLSALWDFLKRNVPGLITERSTAQTSTLEHFDVAGPVLTVPFGTIREGELEVPISLRAHQALLAVAPRLIAPAPLPTADVTVLSVESRSVRLRFTIGGPPQPALPADWPAAQALVVVRVTAISVPKS